MAAGIGILEMLPGKAWFLWMSSRRPPLYPLYVIRWRVIRVILCVLLKKSLYWGNNL